MIEPEILTSRRAFPETQRLFAGAPVGAGSHRSVGWHGTTVEPEAGAIAVVGIGAGLDDLFGEVVRITSGERFVFVYVIGARAVPVDVSISRRAFLSLGLLALDSIEGFVEVVA